MSPIVVIITIICYFALLLGISYVASRGSDNSTFFTGKRQNHWALVSFAMIGAAISGVTFISVPGMVAAKSYSYLQMILGFIVGYFIIAWVLVPLFYKRNLVSIYGYLEQRFGARTYKTGAWFFLVSKMLGAAVRFFVVCAVLQFLVFGPFGIPFEFNVIVTIALIWLYTFQGGVKSIIWTDALKSFCLIMSVVLCIYFIADNMGLTLGGVVEKIGSHPSSRVFFFDNPMEGTYFWKQFIAGVFMAIAMTGLDQDMMQRNLACKDFRESRKNMIVSSIMQFFVVALFLLLGTLLYIYAESAGIQVPENSDQLFGIIASHESIPLVVGVLFVVGLIAAAYSAAGSALTSLTTSFTVDILDGQKKYDDAKLTRVRKLTHVLMSVIMGVVIIVFWYLSTDDAISAVYTLASYTYGPILGLFIFGLIGKKPVHDKLVPVVCIASPCLSWVIQKWLLEAFNYQTSFELLLINAALTIIGLILLTIGKKDVEKPL